ncbi:DUF6930 domain-containing protein [Anaerovibrio sp.]|uniref:DUF6930 domain-containing protein n=1 Tax=Anaerovibrio sp. TaxID=1872532 RepID=UPI003F18472A
MISYDDLYDKLYDNIFALKKAGGWRGLKEHNIVAVRTLHDGTWFCTVIPDEKDRGSCIYVYDAGQGVNVLRQILDEDIQRECDDYLRLELLLSYSGYIIDYGEKQLLQGKAEENRILAYCSRRNLQAGGKRFYPILKAVRPKHIAWPLCSEADVRVVTAVAGVFCLLGEDFVRNGCVSRLIRFDDKIMVPVFSEQEDGSFVQGTMALPKYRETAYDSPDWNDLQAARLKKVRKTSNVWMADCFLMLHGVVGEDFSSGQDELPARAPFYPDALVVLDDATGAMLMVDLSGEDADYGQVLDNLCKLIQSEGRPRQIMVCSSKAEQFFQTLCRRLDIKLVVEASLPELEDIRDDLLDGWEGMEAVEDYAELGQDFSQQDHLSDDDIQRLACSDFVGMVRAGGLMELSNQEFADAVDFCMCHIQLEQDVVEQVRLEYRRRRDEGRIGRLKFSSVFLR